MKTFLRLVATAASALLASPFSAAEPISPADREAILAGWRKLKQADEADKAYSAVRKQTDEPAGAKKERTARAVVILAGERRLIELSLDGSPNRLLHAVNLAYSFSLGRTKPGQADWAIVSTNVPVSRAEFDRLGAEPISCHWLYPLSGFVEASAVDLVDSGKLTLTSLERGGSGTVVGFRYTVSIPERNLTWENVGTMAVDPGNHYLITSASYGKEGSGKPASQFDRKVRANAAAAGGLECIQVSSTHPHQIYECIYSDYSYQPPDPARFTLPYYGLPEPTGVAVPASGGGNRGWLWALLAAGGFAAAMVTFDYVRRRRLSAT